MVKKKTSWKWWRAELQKTMGDEKKGSKESDTPKHLAKMKHKTTQEKNY